MLRSDFLAGASVLALLPSVAAAQTTTQPAPISYSALAKIADRQAKHKQAFVGPKVANGAIFTYMRNSLNGYQFGWNEGPGTLHAVAVFYGGAASLGVDDTAWETLRLRDVLAANGDALTPGSGAASGHPWLHAAPGLTADGRATSPFYNDNTIPTLAARGCTFFLCGNAVREVARRAVAAGTTGGRDEAATYAYLLAHVIPQAMLVPAGVTTVDALHERGFSTFQASA